ncbi:Hypothetical predicted protein [Paramuricea clavata]|uniref:Uncharacterized protein n=1 Tax=Paramuricea clavata TaxID=317549 RepID=A0A6S7H0P8_PARCT|nr:Hypothetical predicted protein [Paramuricea clavata]
MTVVLETIAIVGGCAAVYKLYTEMRRTLEPAEESMTEIKKADKLMKGFQYNKFEENYVCEVFKDILEEDFPAFVNDLQERHKLDKKTTASILDIVRTGARHGNENQFKFNKGKGNMHFEQVIALKTDGKINLAIARYSLSFDLNVMFEEWHLFGFIPMKRKVIAGKRPLTMSECQKEIFRKTCQAKLFNHVAEKCKNQETVEETNS